MDGLLGNKQNVPQADVEKLFDAGIVYLQAGEYVFAYFCFSKGKKDVHTLYNMALCCYRIAWFQECHDLLCEAENKFRPERIAACAICRKCFFAGSANTSLFLAPCPQMLLRPSRPFKY